MPETCHKFSRELTADDLKVGLRVVVMEPYPPSRSVIMTVVELTDTTVRFITMPHRIGRRIFGSAVLCRIRPDGYFETLEGDAIIHVSECLEPPESHVKSL
jgi:hypothetical protein